MEHSKQFFGRCQNLTALCSRLAVKFNLPGILAYSCKRPPEQETGTRLTECSNFPSLLRRSDALLDDIEKTISPNDLNRPIFKNSYAHLKKTALAL